MALVSGVKSIVRKTLPIIMASDGRLGKHYRTEQMYLFLVHLGEVPPDGSVAEGRERTPSVLLTIEVGASPRTEAVGGASRGWAAGP